MRRSARHTNEAKGSHVRGSGGRTYARTLGLKRKFGHHRILGGFHTGAVVPTIESRPLERRGERVRGGRVPRTTKTPYSLNWKVMREEFYATKEAALGAIQGKRYIKGTKTLPIEPLTVKEVRKAVEAGQARRRAKAKP